MADENAGDMGAAPAPLAYRRLEERAIRERWPLPEAARLAILKRLAGYIDPETEEGARAKARTVISAARTILAADRLNLEQQRLDLIREKALIDAPQGDAGQPKRIVIPGADDAG